MQGVCHDRLVANHALAGYNYKVLQRAKSKNGFVLLLAHISLATGATSCNVQ